MTARDDRSRPTGRPPTRRQPRRRPKPRPGQRQYSSQQGVALLAVLVATGMTGVLVAEFSTNTNVDMFASYNARDDMKLHFLGRSGMNLSQLIVRVQNAILDRPNVRQMIGAIQLSDYSSMFMGAFGGSQEEVEGVAAMLGGFAARDMKGLGVPEGRFDVQFTTEDNKINLNCANGSDTSRNNLYAQLVNLFFPKGYDEIFQNEDADGWRRTREEQAAAIIDYIDNNTTRYVPGQTRGTGPEDYGYESLDDRYRSKDNYIDTIGEIRQVRGVDDRFMTLFGDAFTVYGACKLNMDAVENPMLIAMVIAASAKNTVKTDLSIFNDVNILVHAQLVVAARGLGLTFSNPDENQARRAFADFVANPAAKLEEFFSMGGAALGGQTPNIPQEFQNLLMSARPGLELDDTLLQQVATAGPRQTYRIESFASIGDDDSPYKLTKRIVGVWDTKATPQNTRAPGNVDVTGRDGFGAWVYWRED